jgi:hypothetical protein
LHNGFRPFSIQRGATVTINLPGIPSTVQAGVIDFAGAAIPVVELNWMDERQTCATVLRYLAGELEGQPADYETCSAYRNGLCRMQGGGAVCAFHEPDDAKIWRKAAWWRLLERPDGSLSVTPAHSAVEIAADLGAVIVGADLVEVR